MKYFFVIVILLLSECGKKENFMAPLTSVPVNLKLERTLSSIAFGSCNNEERSQSFWAEIVKQEPQLWIWLGDNVYGDTRNMDVLTNKYKKVKFDQNYLKLWDFCPIIGIWDDHDYGVNDGGKSFDMKAESQKVLLDFLDVAPDASARDREGIYQSYTFGEEGKKVKIILLDTRYFRDDLKDDPTGEARYQINPTGDILGESQWEWLKEELTNSDANVHLIASGYQVIPEEQIYEKWFNFPTARQRFFDLLVETKAKNAILLSGDRHISEVSKIELEGLGYPLYEFTSSGLTHTWSANVPRPEPNQYREGEMVIKKSFGMMHFDWKDTVVEVKLEARNFSGGTYLEQNISFSK